MSSGRIFFDIFSFSSSSVVVERDGARGAVRLARAASNFFLLCSSAFGCGGQQVHEEG